MSETTVLKNFGEAQRRIKDVMERPFPIVDGEESIDSILGLLEFHQAALVAERGKIAGIITRADLLKSKAF
jgi:predicted transcriptional regulator